MKNLLLLIAIFLCSCFASAGWIEQTSGVSTTLWSVSAVDDFVAWSCGDNGVVLRTTNSGVNWVQTSFPSSSVSLYTIEGIDANNCLVAGLDGSDAKVYKTTDGGASWTVTFTQSGGFIDAIKGYKGFPGYFALIGDPVGGRWTWFESTDYGSTWDSTGLYKSAASGEAGWNNSCFASSPTTWLWAGTNSTKLIQVFTNGTSADLPTTGVSNTYAVWANDNSRLMTGGDAGLLYSTDGGASFVNAGAIGSGDISAIVGGNTSTWYYTRGSSVYLSTNDGTSWAADYTAGSGVYFHMSLSPRGRYIWAVRDNGGISRNNLDFPLPVELASFSAAVSGRDVALGWTTVSEIDNAGFEVERAVVREGSALQYSKVGRVNGSGTTSEYRNYSFTDRSLATGKYAYRLRQIDYNGNFNYHYLAGEAVIGVPQEFSLSQNYPNPFNPSTVINFDLPFDSKVELKLYDMSGRESAVLKNEFMSAGYHSVVFNSTGLPSGTYFYRLTAGDRSATRKMTLLK